MFWEVILLIYIHTEPLYNDSPWCKTIYSGLVYELEKCKIDYTTERFISCNSGERSFAFIIGSIETWLAERISMCEACGIHPIILSSQSYDNFKGRCSCITSNVRQSVLSVVKYLSSHGRNKTAIYGINPDSITNKTQLILFSELLDGKLESDDIYYNNGSLSECCDRLSCRIHSYDSVISVNDFATVLLMKKYPDLSDRIKVISYGWTTLANKFFPNIINVSMGYEDFGRAAVSILGILENNSAIEHIDVTVKCRFDDELISFLSKNDRVLTFTSENNDTKDVRFYSDESVRKMITLENMLKLCDSIDMDIIDMMLLGKGYEEISEKLFCAENTVKYRVRKMKENCGCTSRKEMISLIKEFCEI